MPYLGRLVILWSTSSPAHRIVLIFWQEVQSCLSAHDFYAESLGQLKGQQVPRSWWRGHPKRYFKTTKFPIFQGKVMKSRLVNQYDSPIDISKNTPYIDAQEVREGSWSFRLIWPSFFSKMLTDFRWDTTHHYPWSFYPWVPFQVDQPGTQQTHPWGVKK